jgi:predicted CoA-substrate-specific enzyme activase
MYVLGLDIGSASSKAVVVDEKRQIAGKAVIQAGTGTSGPGRVVEVLEKETGLKREDMAATVATGYGRYSVQDADNEISEISCHAKGVHFLFPSAHTILDIGGQDAKAISLDGKGKVSAFVMNEKCAAGTGRFLEVMSHVLEIPLDEMGEYDKLSEHPLAVSSTCTVFAESEVISLLSSGAKREDVLRGVHNSVVSRAAGLLYRTKMEGDYVFTGGVAKNRGVVDALERELKQPVLVSPLAQFTGAIGAALYALDYVLEKEESK